MEALLARRVAPALQAARGATRRAAVDALQWLAVAGLLLAFVFLV